MSFIENFFGTAGFITAVIGLTPQVYKAFKTKSTKDIAMVMLINYFLGSVCWTVYGIYTCSKFVIWSNIAVLITSSITIVQKIYYDKRNIDGSSHDS